MLKFLLRCTDFTMPLLALIIYLVQRKKIGNREGFLFFYLLACIIVYGITDIMSLNYINNMALYHFIHWGELAAISYYILRIILKKKYTAYFWVLGIYTAFELVNLALWEPLNAFDSNGAAVGNLMILLLSMYYMLQLSKSDDIIRFQSLPAFWIVSAFLVHCAVSTLVIVAYKIYTMIEMENEGKSMWMIMVFTYVFKFAFIIVGLLCYNQPPRRSSSQRPSLS